MLETELVKAADGQSRWSMLVMHGLGDSMEGYRWLPDALGFKELNYLLINAPDPYYGGYSWFDFPGNAAPGIERSYKLLVELLEHQRQAGFPSEMTFIFGFSQGCLMAWEIGARYPCLLAGLIGISGNVANPQRLLRLQSPVARQQKFLVTHGTLDEILPIEPARKQAMEMKAGGFQVEWVEFDKPHTIAGEAELRIIRRFIKERLNAAPSPMS